MAQTYTINGVDYTFPDVDDSDWGQNVTDWAGAVSSFLLQRTGGTFTLSAEIDFGSSYGLLVKDLSSKTANPASAGFMQLASTDVVAWRNNANSGDINLSKGTDDKLEFNSIDLVDVSTAQTLTNKSIDVDSNTVSNIEVDNLKSGVLDTDIAGGVSGSDDTLASAKAIKTYVDAQVTSSDLDFSGDSGGAQSVDLDSQSLTVEGGTGVDTTGSAQKISIAIDSSVTTNSGTQTLTNKTLTSPKVNEDVVMTTTSTYLNRMDATSNVQAQIDSKQATITGAATTIASSDLTASKVLQSNGSGKVEASTVTTTTLGYLDATSSVQAQLDAKAPLASPYFTTYADFDSQGSAPAAPTNTGDVRLYAKDSKFYFHPEGGSATEIGSGGGVGSIDTLFTIQAKTADAPTSGSGNDAVFLGGGTLNNGGITLDTTAADLIGTDKVFKYDATGDSIRNYWYHEETIYPGYAGKNMVLQLQYYTRNGADSESFRFVARDATKPILSVASDSTNTITGTIDADCGTAAEVGDRIIFKDSSNNIYYRYITVIVKNSGTDGKTQNDNMTYTYSGSDITATGKVLTGVMTDELDYLPLNDITGNEAKTYRKQMSFPDNCTTFQFGFHCLDSDTDIELFYDDIALSADQFLQVSSQLPEIVYAADQPATNSYADNTGMLGLGTALMTGGAMEFGSQEEFDKYMTISGSPTKFEVHRDCEIHFYFGGHTGTSNRFLSLYKNTTTISADGYFVAGSTPSHSSTTFGQIDTSFRFKAGDFFCLAIGDMGGSTTAAMSTTAQRTQLRIGIKPVQNDVVLLNSQDEIFTDWVSDGTFTSHVTGSSGNPTFDGANEIDTYQWRRVGSDMEIMVAFFSSTAGDSAGSGNYFISLPSGYSIDTAKFKLDSTYGGSLGFRSNNNASDCVWMGGNGFYGVGSPFAVSSTQLGIYASVVVNDGTSVVSSQTGAMWGQANLTDFDASRTNVVIKGRFSIPIAGWTSTFNPVLSMPLVDLGSTVEEYHGQGWGNISGCCPYDVNTVHVNTIDKLGTVTDSSAKGWVFQASQRVTATLSGYADTIGYDVTLSIVRGPSSIGTGSNTDAGVMEYVVATEYNKGGHPGGPTATVTLNPGEIIKLVSNRGNALQSDDYAGGVYLRVEKDFSNTNLAHIIKPAVCILKNILAYNEHGGTIATGSWRNLPFNTIEGESWFCTLDDSNDRFTLEPGQYELEGAQPFYRPNGVQTVIYDYSNSKFAVLGACNYLHEGDAVGGTMVLQGAFTITASTTFEYKYQCSYAADPNTNGLGNSMGEDSSVQSAYGQLKIRKLK